MTKLNNQVLGLIRFSYLAHSGGWNVDVSADDYKKRLFSEDRMSLRFRLFENLVLPAINYQTDKDFKCVVICSSKMPEKYQERMLNLIEDHENLTYLSLLPMQHNLAISKACAYGRDEDAEYFTSFRLDDDDMLQKTYVENLKDKVERSINLMEPHKPLVKSFNAGFCLEKTKSGNRVFDVTERMPVAQGTAMTTAKGDTYNVLSRLHRNLPMFFTTVSHSDGPVWLRTIHSNNAASSKVMGKQNTLEADVIEEQLKTHFDLTLDDIKKLNL